MNNKIDKELIAAAKATTPKTIRDPETIRQISLYAIETGDDSLNDKIDPKFIYAGLYPHVMKKHKIFPGYKTNIEKLDGYTVSNEMIVKLLAEGHSQDEVSIQLQRFAISPNSLSYIEKEINRLKKVYDCKTIVQLFCKLKDMKII